MKTIFLDNQSTTPLCFAAREEMVHSYDTEMGNPHSTHHVLGWNANNAVEAARLQIANLIASDSSEIVFTSGATEANNLMLQGVASKADKTRNKILISTIEHKCVLATSRELFTWGFDVEYIPVNSSGVVDLMHLKNMLDEKVLFVSIMAANNEVGSIQPISEISKLAHSYGALVHTDAAQLPIHCSIDVNELGCDFLSLSSHKIFGPMGVGALFVANEARSKIAPIIYGGGQEGGLRSGTLPTALCVGFGAAAKYITDKGEELRNEILCNRNFFWECLLEKLPNIQLVGPSLQERHIGNLSIRFPGIDAEWLLSVLQPFVAASTGSACTSGIPEPSHVLKAIGVNSCDIESVIRFGFNRDHTRGDLKVATAKIAEVLAVS